MHPQRIIRAPELDEDAPIGLGEVHPPLPESVIIGSWARQYLFLDAGTD